MYRRSPAGLNPAPPPSFIVHSVSSNEPFGRQHDRPVYHCDNIAQKPRCLQQFALGGLFFYRATLRYQRDIYHGRFPTYLTERIITQPMLLETKKSWFNFNRVFYTECQMYNFRPTTGHISETIQDRDRITVDCRSRVNLVRPTTVASLSH